MPVLPGNAWGGTIPGVKVTRRAATQLNVMDGTDKDHWQDTIIVIHSYLHTVILFYVYHIGVHMGMERERSAVDGLIDR